MTLELDTSSSGDAADSRLKSDQVWACTFSAVHDVLGLLDLHPFSAVTPAFPAFRWTGLTHLVQSMLRSPPLRSVKIKSSSANGAHRPFAPRSCSYAQPHCDSQELRRVFNASEVPVRPRVPVVPGPSVSHSAAGPVVQRFAWPSQLNPKPPAPGSMAAPQYHALLRCDSCACVDCGLDCVSKRTNATGHWRQCVQAEKFVADFFSSSAVHASAPVPSP